VTHANATLTPTGRLKLARLVVVDGWTLARAAERFSVSVTTARRWAERYRQLGAAGMGDRSSRPRHCPHRLPRRVERRILGLRVARRWGPARIGYHLGLNPATVHKVLQRYRCPRLKWTDPATGTRIKWARAQVHHYVHAAPGDLVHVDIKKLGRIPEGGGHRFLGRQAGRSNSGQRGTGYAYLHHAVDDHTRLAYSEVLPDELGTTCAAFFARAVAYFHAHGITQIDTLMTDNAWAYTWSLRQICADLRIHQIFIKVHCPWQNGKVERLNRTLQTEWAYRHSFDTNDDRTAALAPWLEHYNTQRRHSALGGKPPTSRLLPT